MKSMIKKVKADSFDGKEYIASIKKREEQVQIGVIKVTEEILAEVKEKKDEALLYYTKKFDGIEFKSENEIKVSDEEFIEAENSVSKEFIEALKTAAENIKDFHERQKRNSWINTKENGVILGQLIKPLDRVGIYVPGGTAAYPSSVLMNAIPAKTAGVKEIVMVSPPSKGGKMNPNILVAAKLAGVDEVYKVGGAQAIGALAYGTGIIEKVDKIVGPGNIYVAMAKKSVYGYVDIDMIAGPSEILVIADERANPKYVAADLMSQAEHDKLASSILVTTSEKLADEVMEQLKLQIKTLSRKEIIEKSLTDYGCIILVESLKKAVDVANEIAPEHLELSVSNPFEILGEIKNAGSIFLGDYAPEPLGDYIAGPNHVLPTSGTAKFFSPLSVDDFIKKSSYIYYSQPALCEVKDKIITLADSEGLTAHANSIKVRF